MPCVAKTDTGRDGAQGTAEPKDPATGAMAATASARWHASRVAMKAPADNPVAKTLPGEMLRSSVFVGQPLDERHQEAHVVDALAVGYRCSTTVSPAVVDAVRVHHGEPVLVGDGVVVRQRSLRASGLPCTVQVDHQAGWTFDVCRDVQLIGAVQAPELQHTWGVYAGACQCVCPAVDAAAQQHGKEGDNPAH